MSAIDKMKEEGWISIGQLVTNINEELGTFDSHAPNIPLGHDVMVFAKAKPKPNAIVDWADLEKFLQYQNLHTAETIQRLVKRP